jgi:prepilin-type N-terminal cleavage/methylation domain-containing protein
MKKHQGFTLIELVLVIVILGVLASTAAPKFINLSSDARVSALKTMQGALRSGVDMIHMKAVINQKVTGLNSIDISGINIKLHSGYPTGFWDGSMRYIVDLDSVSFTPLKTTVCEVDWCGKGGQTSLPSGITTTSPIIIGKVYPKGYSFNDECGVYYINNYDSTPPDIGIETKDC